MNYDFSVERPEYQKPKNFNEKDPEFDIFKNVPTEICDAEIRILRNVRISANSVAFNYFKIFPESCASNSQYKK